MEHSHLEQEVLGIHNQGVRFSHRSKRRMEQREGNSRYLGGVGQAPCAPPPRPQAVCFLSFLFHGLLQIVRFPAWSPFSQVTQQRHHCGCNRWISRRWSHWFLLVSSRVLSCFQLICANSIVISRVGLVSPINCKLCENWRPWCSYSTRARQWELYTALGVTVAINLLSHYVGSSQWQWKANIDIQKLQQLWYNQRNVAKVEKEIVCVCVHKCGCVCEKEREKQKQTKIFHLYPNITSLKTPLSFPYSLSESETMLRR